MITVLGATGYIGSNVLKKLIRANEEVYAPGKGENLAQKNLGHIIYCIGMTANFRTKPFETVESHVCVLNTILKECQFESLTYLSSTRVYINSSKSVAEENDEILINPLHADDLYTLTKLTGECLCLSSGRNVKIIRLSNIFGKDFKSDNFLTGIIRKIQDKGHFTLLLSLSSSKDYLFIEDAVNLVIDIALKGKEKVYNAASGRNVSNEEILNAIKKHVQFSYTVAENAKDITFPRISINKISAEFDFDPENILDHIATLLKKE